MRGLTLCLLVGLWSGRARAEGFDARSARASIDPRAGSSIEPTSVPRDGDVALGARLGMSSHPLRLGEQRVVATRTMGELTVSHVLGSRLVFGVDLPFAIQESRPLTPSVAGVDRSARFGLGDLGLHGKLSLLDNDGSARRHGGLGLALLSEVTLPTGNPATFLSERGLRASLRGLIDYDLLMAGVQASAGYRLRTAEVSLGPEVRAGDELPWHLGVWLAPQALGLDPGRRQRWELGLHGSLPVGPTLPFGAGTPGSAWLSPVTLRAGDRVELGAHRDVVLTAGVEVGLTQAIAAPSLGMFLGVALWPRRFDRDRDGVPDDLDRCPELAGSSAHAGCPHVEAPAARDRDGDGIVDADDQCPDEAGIFTEDWRCHGCAVGDADGDGVDDHDDRCPHLPGPPPSGCPAGAQP